MVKRHILILTLATLALIVAGCSNQSGPTAPIDGSANLMAGAISLELPPGAVLETATLNIYIIQSSSHTVNVHRITDDWTEMGVTWNNFGEAYAAGIDGAFTVDGEGWRSADVTGLLQAWLDGTYMNYGFLLEQGTNYPRSIFNSRENAENQPYLEVCYSLDGQIECVSIDPTADAYIWELNPDDNVGARTILYTGWEQETDWTKYALIRFETPETPPPGGCTRTIGFWKTHAGFGPQADAVTPLLPIWLGDAGGAKSLLVDDAQTAVDVLKMKTYGNSKNGITKLYAQLLGAKLNLASGATDVLGDWVTDADAFLADHDYMDWDGLDEDTQQMILDWKDHFDDYNNGELGVPHCDFVGDDD